MAQQGIHSLGHLPHLVFADSVHAITFRLADALPTQLVKEWREEPSEATRSLNPPVSQKAKAELHHRISRYEDAGHGACLLARPQHAQVVQEIILRGHGSSYKLIDWCVMPNHVHVLIRLLDDTSLETIIKRWKADSAIQINRVEGRVESVWMADHYERRIRDIGHLDNAKAHVRNAPVKAGLCEKPEEWPFSSVGVHWSAEFIPPAGANPSVMNSALQFPVSGSSLSGHLDLRCDLRRDGVPFISRQSFRAPIHLSKSHLDQGCLVQSIVNPTAGFFDGDQVRMNVEAGRGAKLVMSTPSASRVYRTRSGAAARNHQRFRVEQDAFLEWVPEPFIPHAGARYFQRTDIHLDPSASLLYFEWLAPGRVAMGEVFAYENLRWELDLTVGGTLVARERYDLQPAGESLEALRAKFPAAHYLSVYAAGIMTRDWSAEILDGMSGEDVYLGHGPLSGGVHVVRALCRDSVAARKLIETLRREVHRAAGLIPAALGRISW